MIVKTKTETFFNVQMTAEQRQVLVVALLRVDEALVYDYLSKDEKEVLNDLRVSLLNAA
jgi:hypothetical protein